MIEPPVTWAVTDGKLRVWKGRVFLGEIDRDHFPGIIVSMAQELRYGSQGQDAPRLASVPNPSDVPLG